MHTPFNMTKWKKGIIKEEFVALISNNTKEVVIKENPTIQ
jgi:hypothetical protein